LPFLARSAALPGDVTGIWFDSHHPGWGLGLMQQNDTVFATLFTYESTGAPSWDVAILQRAAAPASPINDLCDTLVLSGSLYRTQWPAFGSATNPQGNVQVEAAGTMVVMVPTSLVNPAATANTANVRYSIGSAQSTATVTRQTWVHQAGRTLRAICRGPHPQPRAPSVPPNADARRNVHAGGREAAFDEHRGRRRGRAAPLGYRNRYGVPDQRNVFAERTTGRHLGRGVVRTDRKRSHALGKRRRCRACA